MEIEEIFKKYVESKRLEIKETTTCNYWVKAQNHIFPISQCPEFTTWSNVTKEQVVDFLHKDKILCNLGDKTMYDIITLWNSFLKFSYSEKFIENDIIIKVKKPSVVDVPIFNDFERQQIENYLLNHISFVGVGFLFSLLCGLRLGEICALQWRDIDFTNGIVSITKTLARVKDLNNSYRKTKIIVTTPKSARSRRNVPIPDFFIPVLKKLRGLDNWYILTALDKYMEPRLLEKKFKIFLEELTVEYKKFHTLRHTFATNALRCGMDVKTLSELLGHENVAFTLKVYVHSNMEIKKQQINAIYESRNMTYA